MKVMTLLGTRPELIKLSEIIKKLDKHTDHVLVHTGQNYDPNLKDIFFRDLELREPDYYLDAVGNTLGETISNIIKKTEDTLLEEKPDAIVILGDTNSALGGIVAKRMKIPIFHLEAGNRCFDLNVPEEINRTIMDHISDVNLAYTENSRRYLLAEGIAKDRTFIMGSPMKEVINANLEKIKDSQVLVDLGLEYPESARVSYYLVSLHREENVDDPRNLDIILDTLESIALRKRCQIIVSTHPRLKNRAGEKLHGNEFIKFLEPFGFLDYNKLQMNAKCVISDSGTIAEESSILRFPAITIRNAIERPEAVDVGSILMTGVDKESILSCLDVVDRPTTIPADYNIDNCSERVLKIVLGFTPYVNKYVWRKR